MPVSLIFSRMFTGTFLRSRAHIQKIHGQVDAFTGTFLDFFTGTFRGSRAENLENVHGHFSRFTGTFSSNVPKMPEFTWSRVLSRVHGHFFLKMFTGTFEVHGRFFGFKGTFLSSRARFFSKVHGQLQDVHGHFSQIVHGHFFYVHG